ncbi:kinase-like protein [Serendipita vermifera]|nr:kinase-like protein [Serendipita vermifera]
MTCDQIEVRMATWPALQEIESYGIKPRPTSCDIPFVQPISPILPPRPETGILMRLEPLELAQQLTIVESELFLSIKPSEWIAQSTGSNPPSYDNIKAVITVTNKECRLLSNFSSMAAILAGLNDPAILGLKRTWEQVKGSEKTVLSNLRAILDTESHFQTYRSLLSELQPPCVPFLGVYLVILNFIRDNVEDVVHEGTLINFQKRTRIADVLREINGFQIPHVATGNFAVRFTLFMDSTITPDFDWRGRVLDLSDADLSVDGLRAKRGGYSIVYPRQWEGKLIAIKKIMPIEGTALSTMRRKIQREGVIWATLNHPNILPLIGFTDNESFLPFGAFVSPWCTLGNSENYLTERRDSISLNDRIELLRGTIRGIDYLHSHNPQLIHGDIKPLNILITEDGVPQVCDFGLTRIFLQEGSSGLTTTSPHGGTERYLAPELLDTNDTCFPTLETDVYALGCVGLKFIFDMNPYSNRLNNYRGEIFADIKEGVPPTSFSPAMDPPYGSLAGILQRTWTRKRTDRPNVREFQLLLDEVMDCYTRLSGNETGIVETDGYTDISPHLPLVSTQPPRGGNEFEFIFDETSPDSPLQSSSGLVDLPLDQETANLPHARDPELVSTTPVYTITTTFPEASNEILGTPNFQPGGWAEHHLNDGGLSASGTESPSPSSEPPEPSEQLVIPETPIRSTFRSGLTASMTQPSSAGIDSPRTIRLRMLSSELPEDLRKDLLWERRMNRIRPHTDPSPVPTRQET